MRWYCALTEPLLDEEKVATAEKPLESLLEQLEEKIVLLYKAILLYQMRSVRYYYRNQAWNFVLQLGNSDNWDEALQDVTAAEEVLQKDSEWYYKEDTKGSLHKFTKSAKAMVAQLGDIGQTLQDFITSQEGLHQHEKNMRCLRDLRAGAVDPRDDVERIESQKEDLLPNVFEWIIHSNQFVAFTNWTDPALPLRRLMWINGPAGTGKTMLLIGIIRNLSAKSAVLAPSISYFFYEGTGSKKLNNATGALRSLIWMLLIQQPHLISHVQPSHEMSGSALFSDGNEFIALKRIFQSMLEDPALPPVYLIVDALDECDQTNPGLEELIKVISKSFTLSNRVNGYCLAARMLTCSPSSGSWVQMSLTVQIYLSGWTLNV